MSYNTFEEMPIWQKAMEMAVNIFRLTENLPKKEDYGLTSQIRRSALSVQEISLKVSVENIQKIN